MSLRDPDVGVDTLIKCFLGYVLFSFVCNIVGGIVVISYILGATHG